MKAKFTSFDQKNHKIEIFVDPESFVGDEIAYLIQSKINNAIVVVSDNEGITLVDNRQLKITPLTAI